MVPVITPVPTTRRRGQTYPQRALLAPSAPTRREQQGAQRGGTSVSTPQTMDALYDEVQFVYATAKVDIRGKRDLRDGAGDAAAGPDVRKGETMRLVFPMRQVDADDGSGRAYYMRCKKVNAKSGAVQMFWVCVVRETVSHASGGKRTCKRERYISDFRA